MPLDFYYKKEPKPNDIMNDWIRLIELPSEFSPKKKKQLKKENEIIKPAEVVKIYKCDPKYTREKYQALACQKVDAMKKEELATDLRDSMIMNPDDYRLMELSPSDYNKIKSQMKEFSNVDAEDFKYYEIIRDVEDTAQNSPFTGNFESFSKMIEIF